MKKRLIALFCTLALLLPCVTVVNAASSSFPDIPAGTAEDDMLRVLKNLGIMHGCDDGNFNPDNAITRAEFVTMICNSVKVWNSAGGDGGANAYEEFFKNFFLNGGANGMELLIPGTEEEGETVRTSLWTDVDESHWAYSYMKSAATYGVVSGYPDGTFRPANTITYNEAITVILNLCGYREHAKNRGGFPDGYNTLATHFNLSKGLYATGAQELSRMDAARLLYNSFDIKLATATETNGDETFLNDVVGVYIVEGTLTDTDITSIYYSEDMKAYEARVNDVTFTFDKDDIAIRDYIGQDIRVYMTETGVNTYEYVMRDFELIGKEDKTVIEADLFEDYANNTFYYKTDKDAKRTKEVDVRNGSVLIYNGKYKPNYDKTIFENINQGTITVIEKDSLDFDIIVVEDFKSGYVDSKNATDMEIYDNIAEGVGNSIISLKSDEENRTFIYSLMDENGEEIKFEDIATGAINYYQNDGYIKLYFTNKTVKGTLKRDVDEDGDIYYVVDGESYKVSDTYLNYVGGEIRYNLSGAITIDKYNEVVWMSDDVDMTGYSYIFKSRYITEDDQVLITYYDINAGEVKENVVLDEKVKFYGVDGLSKSYSMERIVEELQGYDGVAKVDLNDDGYVKRIRLALANAEGASDQLMLVQEGTYDYNAGKSGFGGIRYLNSDSKMLNVPLDKTNYDNFKLLAYNANLWTGSGRPFKLYSFDAESPYAKIALAYQASSTSTGIYVDTSTKYYLVTKIIDTINSEGELAREATLYDGNTYTTVIANEDETGKTAFENAFGANAASSTAGYKVERGDFIFYTTDAATGAIENIRIIFDANAVNPAWCGCDPDDKATTCTQNHTHITNLGHFPGTTGYYAQNAYAYTNPIGYLNSGSSGYGRSPGSSNNRQFYVLGYINQVKEGMYEWTTQNIRDGWDGDKDTENYQWAYDTFPTSIKVYIVDEETNVTTGNLQSIKTYKQAGNKCSKLLIRYVGGTINAVWILPN